MVLVNKNRYLDNKKGACMVEAAIGLGIFFTLGLGTLNFGLFGFNYIGIQHVFQEAAREAAVDPNKGLLQGKIQRYLVTRLEELGLRPEKIKNLSVKSLSSPESGGSSLSNIKPGDYLKISADIQIPAFFFLPEANFGQMTVNYSTYVRYE